MKSNESKVRVETLHNKRSPEKSEDCEARRENEVSEQRFSESQMSYQWPLLLQEEKQPETFSLFI